MNWLDKIEDYIDNSLSAEEKNAMEDALKQDASLRKSIKNAREYRRVRDEYVKDVFRNLFEQDRQKRIKNCKKKVILLWITALMVLAILGIYFFSKK